MRALQRHELVRLFNRQMLLPSTRKMAGDTFEAYCHVVFSTRIEFDFVPMVRIGGQPQTKARKYPQWHSSHIEIKESDDFVVLEALRVNASANKASLGINPSLVIDYNPGDVAQGFRLQADVCYIPNKTNQVGIDSFILHGNHLYLLQMIVSGVQGIKRQLNHFLLSLQGLPPRSN